MTTLVPLDKTRQGDQWVLILLLLSFSFSKPSFKPLLPVDLVSYSVYFLIVEEVRPGIGTTKELVAPDPSF